MTEAVTHASPDTSGPGERRLSVCDLALRSLNKEPFPHLVNHAFIEPRVYDEVRRTFPNCPPQIGPTGFSLYWGDDAYRQLLDAEPAWQSLFKSFHSQSFIDWASDQFAEVWEQDGCKVELAKARYVPYCEDRIDKERGKLRRIEHEPHELWVRMDIHQGRMGYDRPVHLDHARRLLSMLIYLCDQTESEMTGGELFLHCEAKRDVSHASANRITPHHNLMVAFPCSDRSFHSVSPITAQRSPRNYIQVHISSSVDIWPRKPIPAWRLRLGSLQRRLGAG